MNHRQQSRLQRLEAALGKRNGRYHVSDYEERAQQAAAFEAGEGPYPADPPCPPGEDPDFWSRLQRSSRIRDRRRFEMIGHEKRAAEIPIDPPPTADELRGADEFFDAIRPAALRTLFEEEGSELTFDAWLAEHGEGAEE